MANHASIDSASQGASSSSAKLDRSKAIIHHYLARQVATRPGPIWLRSDLFSREINVARKSYHLSDGFDVPPGEHFVIVETDSRNGKPDDAMRDLRIAFTGARMEVASH